MKNTLNYSKYTERDMVIDFCKILETQNLVFAVEVPFMNRSVDLVFYKEGKIKAIEFKLHDWKKAIKQAKVHSLGADEIYICLPYNLYFNRVEQMKEVLEINHCGLILFNTDTKQIDEIFSFDNQPNWEGGIAIMRKGVDYSVQNQNYRLLVGNP